MSQSQTLRPRRSVLYMPGANQRAMAKARTLAADGIILDLEDAVAPDAKAQARGYVAEAVAEGGYQPREVLIRINPLDSPWGLDDLAMAASLPIDGLVVPKIESAEMVNDVARRLAEHGSEDLPIWAMVETPIAVMRIADIALNARNLGCLLMGTSDLSKELRLPHDAPVAGLMWSLAQAVVAARAAGVDVIDGVHLDIQDADGFKSACQRARAYGFDGKSLIHPSQIEVANKTFGPSAADVEHAGRVQAAHADAIARDSGVAVLDGKLVENLHVDMAERTLAVHQAIEALVAAREN